MCEKEYSKTIDCHSYTTTKTGVVEMRNRTLLHMVRSMMAQTILPISYWGDALITAMYRRNRVPSKSVPCTPYELWRGRKTELVHLRSWGCATYVRNLSHQYGKLCPKENKCIFIRYSLHSNAYVFIGENSKGTVTEFGYRDEFLEENFP